MYFQYRMYSIILFVNKIFLIRFLRVFLRVGGISNKTLPDCNGMNLRMDYIGGRGGANTVSKDKSFKFT